MYGLGLRQSYVHPCSGPVHTVYGAVQYSGHCTVPAHSRVFEVYLPILFVFASCIKALTDSVSVGLSVSRGTQTGRGVSWVRPVFVLLEGLGPGAAHHTCLYR